MTRLPPEFHLLAACCRWPDDARRAEAIRAAATTAIDWDRFARLVRRHRAVALVATGLRHLPQMADAPREALRSGAQRQVSDTLALAAECLRLQALFTAAGIPMAIVKGVPLAILTYGDPGLKQSRDIDVVIAPEHLEAGWRLMLEAGYVRMYGGLDPSPEELDLVFDFAKDLAFAHPAIGIVTELHFRLVRNPHVLPGLRADERTVTLGGATLRTMSDEAYYAYLCVHAASHAIGRLKWLADIAALISVTGGRVAELHAAAVRWKAGRASLLVLLLCHDLMGLEVPAGLLAQARANPMVRLLAANARAALADERWDEMREARIARERLSQLLTQKGRAFWFELGAMWASESDRRAFPLPRALHGLYHVVRIPSWGARAALRLVRSLRG